MMHSLLLGALFAVTVDSSGSARLCSRFVSRGIRPDDVVQLTLRATPESLPDPRRELADPANSGYGRRLVWDTATVYGQVFDLIRVDGTAGTVLWRGHPRVVLVWWRDGLQCQRMTPRPAVRRDVEDLFLLARPEERPVTASAMPAIIVATLRSASQWVKGMPTIDVTGDAWMYSPSERRPADLPPSVHGALSIPEYREFFAHLPRSSSRSYAALQSGWRRLVTWGEANPRRWTMYPAAGMLCAAAKSVQADALARQRCPP